MPEKIADKVSITICGDGGCDFRFWILICIGGIGKSSITLRLVRSQWTSEYDPTIEDSYSVTRAVDGLSYHLALTDTAGQEEYRGLWASSNLQSDAFLLVYDITNASSIDGLTWFLEMVEIEADNRIEQNNQLLRERGPRVRGKTEEGWRASPVVIVVGNKCDLNTARVISSKTGWEWARSRGCGFMETSAKEMVNIEETFAWIVRKVVEARKAEETGTQQHQSHNSGPVGATYQSYGLPEQSEPQPRQQPTKQISQVPLNEKSGFEEEEELPWWKKMFACGCFGHK